MMKSHENASQLSEIGEPVQNKVGSKKTHGPAGVLFGRFCDTGCLCSTGDVCSDDHFIAGASREL